MRRQETVLKVHSWRERQLADSAQDQRPVGRLVGVLPEYHGPANIEGPHTHRRGRAMHIQRVFGQRVRGHFYHHRRKLTRGVVVLLARYTMPWPEVKFTTRRPVTARAVETFGMCWR